MNKQRFILAKTEADFKNEEAEGLICGCDIAFIVEPNNKDIYTHGIYMLKEIKTDITELKSKVDGFESRISLLETDVTNIKISLNNLENRVTVNETNISNLERRITAVENAITNINSQITEVKNDISKIKQNITNIEGDIENIENDITTINNKITTIDLSNYYTKAECDSKYLTSHQQLKTINGQSLIGTGDITIETGSTGDTYWSLSGTTLSPVNSSYEVSAKTFYASSDRTVKKNINAISDEDIEKLDNINLVEYAFDWDEDTDKHFGVIAQDVERAGLESLVTTNDHKQVDYTSLLILYIAKLEREIETIKQKLNNYEQTSSDKE